MSSSLGLAREPPEEARLVFHPPEPALDQRDQLIDVALDPRLAIDLFDSTRLAPLGSAGCMRREPVDGQPFPHGDRLAHRAAGVVVRSA